MWLPLCSFNCCVAFFFLVLAAAHVSASPPVKIERVTTTLPPTRIPIAASLFLPAIAQRTDPSLLSPDILGETRRYIGGFYPNRDSLEFQTGGQIACRDRAAALVAFLRKRGGDARLVYGDYGHPTALFGHGARPSQGHAWVHLVLPSGATWVVDPTFCTMEEWRSGENHPLVEKPYYGLYCIEFATSKQGRVRETVFRAAQGALALNGRRNATRTMAAASLHAKPTPQPAIQATRETRGQLVRKLRPGSLRCPEPLASR